MDSLPQFAHSLGLKLKAERLARKLTLEQLADHAEVSKRLLISLEKGEANPSIAVLLKLAQAFDLTLPELFGTNSDLTIRKTGQGQGTTLWKGAKGGTGILVSSTKNPGLVELWQWTLQPGESYSSEAHISGTRELVTVESGTLTLTCGEEGAVLQPQDAASFLGDLSHSYSNRGKTPTRFTLVVSEPIRPLGTL